MIIKLKRFSMNPAKLEKITKRSILLTGAGGLGYGGYKLVKKIVNHEKKKGQNLEEIKELLKRQESERKFSEKEEKKHIVSDGLGLTSGALTAGAVGSLAFGEGQRIGSRLGSLKHKLDVNNESISGLIKKNKIKDAGKFIQEGLKGQDTKLLNKSRRSIKRGGKLALGAVGVGVASKLAKKLEKRDKSEK